MISEQDPFSNWRKPKVENDPFSRWRQPAQEKKAVESSAPSAIKEVPQQFAKGVAAGSLGTYGDIFDLLGIQPKKTLKGEEIQRGEEFKSLGRLAQGKQSLADIMTIGEDEILPRYSRLPSTEEASGFIGEHTGVGEPETFFGKTAKRGGRLAGSIASTGPGTSAKSLLTTPIAAAGVGQTLEELGAPPWAQAAAEIVTFMKMNPSKAKVTSKSPEIKTQLNKLREMGYSENDVTLAKNALEERGFLEKLGKPTPASTKKFEDLVVKSNAEVKNAMKEGAPGIEKGINFLKESSNELFSDLESFSKNVTIKNPSTFQKAASDVIKNLEKSLANTPQEKQVIGLLEDAFFNASKEKTGEHFINFYKGLNQIGNWSSPSQREYVFSKVKDAVKQTFKDQGPEGSKLAKMLETANDSYVKLKRAEDALELLGKATTDEGLNFKKLAKALEDPDKFKTLSDSIGKDQANKVKFISKITEKSEGLKQRLEGSQAKKAFGTIKAWELAKSLASLDFKNIAVIAGSEVGGRLANRMLTDARFQNMYLRFVENLKSGNLEKAAVLVREMSS